MSSTVGCSGCVLMQESNGNICRTRADFYFILYRGNKWLHDKNGCGAGEMKWKSTEKMTGPFWSKREWELWLFEYLHRGIYFEYIEHKSIHVYIEQRN